MDNIDSVIRDFSASWCDFLDECPNRPGVFIGDYDCQSCKDCLGCDSHLTEEWKNLGKCDYKRYTIIRMVGKVKCANRIKNE